MTTRFALTGLFAITAPLCAFNILQAFQAFQAIMGVL